VKSRNAAEIALVGSRFTARKLDLAGGLTGEVLIETIAGGIIDAEEFGHAEKLRAEV
jgi:hypothetical protein